MKYLVMAPLRTAAFPNSVGIGALLVNANIGKGVDDDGADVRFGHLSLEGSRVQAVAQLLQPVHHVLGDAAPVVVAIALPAGAALGGDILENNATGMIVAPGNSTVPRGNGGTGVPVGNGGMAAFDVVGAIGRHLRDFAFDLVKQTGEHFAVTPIGRRHFNANDILGGLVDGQVDFAPGAALADPVLAHFPFPFTEDLQAGRVDHDVRQRLARPTRNLHRNLIRAARHVRVLRYRKIQLPQAHQRLHQPFGGTVRQLEQGLGRLRVQPGLAPSDWGRGRLVVSDTGIVCRRRGETGVHKPP